MTSIEDARKMTAMPRIADDEHTDVSNDDEHADVSDHERLRMVETVLVGCSGILTRCCIWRHVTFAYQCSCE